MEYAAGRQELALDHPVSPKWHQRSAQLHDCAGRVPHAAVPQPRGTATPPAFDLLEGKEKLGPSQDPCDLPARDPHTSVDEQDLDGF